MEYMIILQRCNDYELTKGRPALNASLRAEEVAKIIESRVSAAMAEGWRPTGGIMMEFTDTSSAHMAQAMIRGS